MSELKYRMIFVGLQPAGLLGLDELIESLIESGCTPEDEDLSDKLVSGIREHNFIPKPAVEHYRQALQREFQMAYTLHEDGKGSLVRDYGTWEGHPREHIPWFPSVAPEVCNGCGKCIKICPKDVLALDKTGKAFVIEPFLCIVGCCFCRSACDPHAIHLPKREMMDQYRFNH